MRVLWAPWRMAYIGAEKPEGCIFCPRPGDDRRKAFILWETESTLVMLNRYPYASGHLLVAPRRHVARPDGLEPEEFVRLMRGLHEAIRAACEAFRPEGMNVGMNLGRAAGAGIEEHLHWHIVPRWNGDTNFMPLLAEVRVLPEHLESTYERLLPFFSRL